MDKIFKDSIAKYFRTLGRFGKIKDSDAKKLFIALMIHVIYLSLRENVRMTSSEVLAFENAILCFMGNSCLFPRRVTASLLDEFVDVDSLITFVDETIATIDGASTVSFERRIKRLDEFEHRDNIENDQYLVGYDEGDQTEIRINVSDLDSTLYWEYD